MQIVSRLIKDLKQNPGNPRVIKDAAFKKLVRSIKEAPWMLDIRPIVIDESGIVLGGNMRLKACVAAGLTHVPTIQASALTEEQKREFIIKDNVGYGDWDVDILSRDWDIALLKDWGLEIDFKTEDAALRDEDAPEARETDIVLGDLILLGEHRVLCGDSTNPQHVERVLGGAVPYLMITDPPYGVEYDASWRNGMLGAGRARALGKVENDDRADWSATWSLSPSSVAYVYHASTRTPVVWASLEQSNFEIRSMLIWVKNHFAISRSHYHHQHEPVLYAVKRGARSQFIGDRKQTTVWEIDKPTRSESGHSTQKPIECMARPIRNHEGDVYDPFLGSGTTLLAAHSLKRKCYGLEINPQYCQIILDRFKAAAPDARVEIIKSE